MEARDSSGQTMKKCVVNKDRFCYDEFDDRRIECELIRQLQEKIAERQESLKFWLNRVECDNAVYDSSSTKVKTDE